MGKRIGRFAFYTGKIARGNNGVNPSWRGYCYGSWLPRISSAKYRGCRYYDASWLCYHATLYIDRRIV